MVSREKWVHPKVGNILHHLLISFEAIQVLCNMGAALWELGYTVQRHKGVRYVISITKVCQISGKKHYVTLQGPGCL